MARSRPGRPRGARRGAAAWLPVIAALIAALIAAAPAAAHEVGLSRGEYVVSGAVVDAEITFSRGEIASLVPALDADKNGRIDPEELTRARPAVDRALTAGVAAQRGGAACPAKLEEARLVEEDGLAVRLQLRCRSRSGPLGFALPVLQDLAYGHRHIAHVVAGPITADHVLHRRSPSFEVAAGAAPEPEPPASGPVARSAFVAGVLAMITGLEHVAFVVGLVLLGGRLRSILLAAVVLAALHALALALAAFDVLGPAPGFLGPAIALSVAYAGVEAWAASDGGERWRFVAPLGLLHGFGLAGALSQADGPAERLPVALVSFNLGALAGLLVILAVVVPLVIRARRHARIAAYGRKGLSVILVVAGVFWLVAGPGAPRGGAGAVQGSYLTLDGITIAGGAIGDELEMGGAEPSPSVGSSEIGIETAAWVPESRRRARAGSISVDCSPSSSPVGRIGGTIDGGAGTNIRGTRIDFATAAISG